jgi:cytoskeletal protein CcmA (bactofilin family)
LHKIDDDFFAACNTFTVEGEVTGDLFVTASSVRILGTVGRSVNAATQNTDHDGTIGGSLRWFGSRLTVNGPVDGSLMAMGGEVIIDQGTVIGRDAYIAAGRISHSGVINAGATLEGETIVITGRIEGDVKLTGRSITLSPPAIINGNLTYIAEKEDQFTLEPGATVTGEVVWKQPEVSQEDDSGLVADVAFRLASLLAAFLFGVFMFMLVGPYAEEASHQLNTRLVPSFAAGLLTLLGLVIAMIILLLALAGTLIGSLILSDQLAILGLITLVLSILMIPITSFATVSGAVLLYSGKIVVGLLIGCFFVRRWNPNAGPLNKTALFLGLLVLTLAAAIPYVGLAIFILAAIVGAGAIILGIHNCRRGLARKKKEESGDQVQVSE